jgi:ABC-type sugar transport system ATPase subunit
MINSAEPLLRLSGVSKSYVGVRALADVDFASSASSIHAVLGENGAGKSTLIKIISGVVTPDSGVMTFNGRPRHSPRRRTPMRLGSSASTRSCRSCPTSRWPTTSASPTRRAASG